MVKHCLALGGRPPRSVCRLAYHVRPAIEDRQNLDRPSLLAIDHQSPRRLRRERPFYANLQLELVRIASSLLLMQEIYRRFLFKVDTPSSLLAPAHGKYEDRISRKYGDFQNRLYHNVRHLMCEGSTRPRDRPSLSLARCGWR